MERMQKTCGNCCGTGVFAGWQYVESDNHRGKWEDVFHICEQCNGTGYTEYVVFSVKEAEAILKHCGLTTES